MRKIVIVGAGASGLVASLYAKTTENEVLLLEKNNICGKKLLQTGSGKCNYFNANQSLANYHSTNPEILEKIITPENVAEVLSLFNSLGIIPKIKNGYYYPSSNQASSIKNALVNAVKAKNVLIKENFTVTEITKEEAKFIIKGNNETIYADSVIISTGGLSFPKTGSTGDGYLFAKKFNHTIIKPLPSLVQLKTKARYLKDWAGVRTDTKLTLLEDSLKVMEEEGELQLTSYGLSGICIFNLSGRVARGLYLGKKEEVSINFIPFIASPSEWFNKRKESFKNELVQTDLEKILNYKLVEVILKESNIKKTDTYSSLNKEKLSLLFKNLTAFQVHITETNSFEEAQTTTGGLSLLEINPKNLASSKCKNLYFTGEVLDVDASCGGYNLTFAFLTGRVAGLSAKGEEND